MSASRRWGTTDELGPDDDPYAAYLIWRAERDAAAAADGDEADDAAADDPDRPKAATAAVSAIVPTGLTSWVRKLAIWRRNAG